MYVDWVDGDSATVSLAIPTINSGSSGSVNRLQEREGEIARERDGLERSQGVK